MILDNSMIIFHILHLVEQVVDALCNVVSASPAKAAAGIVLQVLFLFNLLYLGCFDDSPFFFIFSFTLDPNFISSEKKANLVVLNWSCFLLLYTRYALFLLTLK